MPGKAAAAAAKASGRSTSSITMWGNGSASAYSLADDVEVAPQPLEVDAVQVRHGPNDATQPEDVRAC